MLKLSHELGPDRRSIVRLEGVLTQDTVAQLSSYVCSITDQPTLDLGGLTGIDAAGREALLRFRSTGSRLRGGSLYIQRLLEEA